MTLIPTPSTTSKLLSLPYLIRRVSHPLTHPVPLHPIKSGYNSPVKFNHQCFNRLLVSPSQHTGRGHYKPTSSRPMKIVYLNLNGSQNLNSTLILFHSFSPYLNSIYTSSLILLNHSLPVTLNSSHVSTILATYLPDPFYFLNNLNPVDTPNQNFNPLPPVFKSNTSPTSMVITVPN